MTLEMLVFFLLLVLSCQLVVLLYMSLTKWKEIRKEKSQSQVKEELLPLLLNYLIDGNEDAFDQIIRHRVSPNVIEQILFEYIDNINSKQAYFRINEIIEMKLLHVYKKNLYHETWAIRMNTIYALRIFRVTHFGEMLFKRLISKKCSKEETLQIFRALAAFGWTDILDYIETYNLSERDMTVILQSYDIDYICDILQHAKRTEQESFLIAVIIIIGQQRYDDGFSFIQQHLYNPNLEVRIEVLRAYYEMSYMVDPKELIPFFTSPFWVERMQVAKICGILGLNQFQYLLIPLISDESWWVRYYAGQAISSLPNGDFLLSNIIINHDHNYAKDMAKQWMETKEGIISGGIVH